MLIWQYWTIIGSLRFRLQNEKVFLSWAKMPKSRCTKCTQLFSWASYKPAWLRSYLLNRYFPYKLTSVFRYEPFLAVTEPRFNECLADWRIVNQNDEQIITSLPFSVRVQVITHLTVSGRDEKWSWRKSLYLTILSRTVISTYFCKIIVGSSFVVVVPETLQGSLLLSNKFCRSIRSIFV